MNVLLFCKPSTKFLKLNFVIQQKGGTLVHIISAQQNNAHLFLFFWLFVFKAGSWKIETLKSKDKTPNRFKMRWWKSSYSGECCSRWTIWGELRMGKQWGYRQVSCRLIYELCCTGVRKPLIREQLSKLPWWTLIFSLVGALLWVRKQEHGRAGVKYL